MKQIVLYDPYLSGHHLSYLRIYSSVFLELGYAVSIMTIDVDIVEQYLSSKIPLKNIKIKKITLNDKVKIKLYSQKTEGIGKDLIDSINSFQFLCGAKKNLLENDIDKNAIIFFMWFDSLISKFLIPAVVDAIFPYNFSGIWFHPCDIKNYHDPSRRHRGLLYFAPILSSKKLKFLGLFDDLIVEQLCQRYSKDIFVKLPDIAERHLPDFENELVQEIKVRSLGRKIVSLLGSLDRRKNVVSFFEAVRKYQGEDVFFVCAGQLHRNKFNEEEIRTIYEIADTCRNKVYFFDKTIVSDVVFDSLFQISDILVAVYRNFTSSSNMISKSTVYEKPILVSDEYLMGQIVAKYQIGVCVPNNEPGTLIAGIERILSEEGYIKRNFDAFAKEISIEKLRKGLDRISS